MLFNCLDVSTVSLKMEKLDHKLANDSGYHRCLVDNQKNSKEFHVRVPGSDQMLILSKSRTFLYGNVNFNRLL